jgi:hypothetical protein
MKKIQEDKIIELFKDFKFLNNIQAISGKLPEVIFNELKEFTEIHRKIKNHELNFLFEHYNAGLNSYQISVQKPFVEASFTFPFLIALGQFFLYKYYKIPFQDTHRKLLLRENVNHYDGYDLWINYTKEGDENPFHNHGGFLTGVIYIQNTEKNPTIFLNNVKHHGLPGEILMFPADLKHAVEKQIENTERITMSFNLNFNVNLQYNVAK